MALFSVKVFLYPSKKSSQRGGVVKIVVTPRIKSSCLGLRAKEISRESVVETIIYLHYVRNKMPVVYYRLTGQKLRQVFNRDEPMALFSVAVFLYPSKKSSQRGGVVKIL